MENEIYNRKHKKPSELMTSQGDGAYYCDFLWNCITIHCDGNVSCGLDDPFASRSFGNVNEQTVKEIWANTEYITMRKGLLEGKVCQDCTLYTLLPNHIQTLPQSYSHNPEGMIIEPTIRCNIKCKNEACLPNNNQNIKTRDSDYLSFNTYSKVLDEIGKGIKFMYFFNYGEPFLHPSAEKMIKYAKTINPNMNIVSSTNGIPLVNKSRAEKLVESGLDHITYTIAGVRGDSYCRYHDKDTLKVALQGMENVCKAKIRYATRKPIVLWRYLIFQWNESEDEIEEAKLLSKKMGVDQLSFYLTHIPLDAAPRRLSPVHHQIRGMVDYAYGYDDFFGDRNGLFKKETCPQIGSFHWTSREARIYFKANAPWFIITLGTNRLIAKNRAQNVITYTPWGRKKTSLRFLTWKDIYIFVPPTYRNNKEIEIILHPEEPWYPSKENGSVDFRCLGVMVKSSSGCFRENNDSIPFDNNFPNKDYTYPIKKDPLHSYISWATPITTLKLPCILPVQKLAFASYKPINFGEQTITIVTPWQKKMVIPSFKKWKEVYLKIPVSKLAVGYCKIYLSMEAVGQPVSVENNAENSECGVMIKQSKIWTFITRKIIKYIKNNSLQILYENEIAQFFPSDWYLKESDNSPYMGARIDKSCF